MGIRRKARELALQCLYQIEQCGNQDVDIQQMREHFEVSKKAVDYGQELISGIKANLSEIDGLISQHAVNWRLDRMSVIDRNLLRIAVFELVFSDDVPASVAINEAIEIAKRFSTPDAGSFLNGILDSIRRSSRT
jgi:N utilization substance protein B